MSSLLSVLQDWLQNDRTRHQQLPVHQDYENLVKLISDYQHTMNHYQSNMSTYLLLLTSLQVQLSSSTTEIRQEENPSPSSTSIPTTTEQPQRPSRPQRTSTRVYPRSSTSRIPGNRSYANVASNNLIPFVTRYQPTQPNRVSDSLFSTTSTSNETTRLFDSLVRENRGGWTHLDVCGNSLFRGFGNTPTENAENRLNSLFPPLSSTPSEHLGGNVRRREGGQSNSTTTTTNPSVNLIDIVFEYDDQPFHHTEEESILHRMVQNDDFRNRILRMAGLNNQEGSMRWFVAPTGFDDSEARGLTMEEIRGCTELLVFEEGREGLLSTTCPITMEEFSVGDRLLQLRECRHAFRERELVEWFQRHSTCPICRTSFGG